ncbi:MAG TPA: SRPBCC family protein [Candidatus Thermoplasmatota archaeon]
MAKLTVTRDVPVRPEIAFDRWLAAYERLHELYPEKIKSMKVIEWNGNERKTACVENWAGRDFSYTMAETLFPPGRVEQRIVEGRGKGSSGSWVFAASAGGTLITVEQRMVGVEGFFLGVLFRKTFRREIEEGLARYAKFIEQSPPEARVTAAAPRARAQA